MFVSIRVRPFVNGRPTRGSADSAPFAAVVGRLGHRFERRDLDAKQIETLASAGMFEIRDAATGEELRRPRLVLLVPRDDGGERIVTGARGQ